MEKRTAFLLVVSIAISGAAAAEKRAARVYTNDDLARVAPFRSETGVHSLPATEPRATVPARDAVRRPASRGEDYWQREADRVRERVRPLEKRAVALRRSIHERWKLPGVAPMTDPKLIEWRRELQEAEADIRELQERLEERARRDGALPGWLR